MSRKEYETSNRIIPDQLIKEEDAARILGKHVQTLRNDRHYHRGAPYIKIGRSVRYSLQDMNRYIRSNRVDPEAI